jgi:Flp pilus assembly protein TadD
MRKSALILLCSALALTAAAASVDRELEFVRAVNEADPAARGEMLLKLAEREDYPAELALIYLTRAQLPPKSLKRMLPIFARSGNGLVPAVLLVRAFRAEAEEGRPEPMPLDELFAFAHAAWKKAAERKHSPFEEGLFRELSGEVLPLAWECGETAKLFPELKRRIESRGDMWVLDFPFNKMLEFLNRYAFAAEGFELYSPAWSESPEPGRRALAALLETLPKHPPRSADEAAERVDFLIGVGEGRAAMLVAAERLDKHSGKADAATLKRDVSLLVYAMIESGGHDVFDHVRPLIDADKLPAVKAATFANGGKCREALALLPQVPDPETRARLEWACRMRLGEFDAAAQLAKDPSSPLSKRMRILALLELAELRGDRSCFEAAAQLAGKEIDTDASFANSFGYVALKLGLDRDTAERRIRYALSVRPHESAFVDSLAWARYIAGDHAGAWKLIEAALRNCDPQPESCEILAHAGAIRLALGDREGARRYCGAALKLALAGEKSPRHGMRYGIYAAEIRKMLEQLK